MTMKGHWRGFFSCVCMWQTNTRILVLFGHIHIVMDKCIFYLFDYPEDMLKNKIAQLKS